MMLELVEHFVSIQGEGKYSGKFAMFFRFAKCNLKCKGFSCQLKSPKTGEILVGCDTIRAVYSNHFENKQIQNSNELLNLIPNFKNKPIIVITGGEPLLNYQNEIFYDFVKKLLKQNYEIHFETNGTILIDFDKYPIYKSCIFCISIKLENSGEQKDKRIKYDALKAIKNNAKDSFYKFVISQDFDLIPQIEEILYNAKNEVYCMPLGKDRQELEKNAKFVAELCIRKGYNYSDRLHIRIWNDKIGV